MNSSNTTFSRDYWHGEDYAINSNSQKESAEECLQLLQFKGTEAILDVGCGEGKISSSIARKVPEGMVIGVDISPSMIHAAKKSWGHVKNLSFQIQDATTLSFNNQFDIIVSFTAMQWVMDQSRALFCFKRALKKRGTILIQMPIGLPPALKEAVQQTASSDAWKLFFNCFSPPWRFFQPEEYRNLLTEIQFSPQKINTFLKHERFPSREIFTNFLKQWLPYLRPIPDNLKNKFLSEVIEAYLKILPCNNEGQVMFSIHRLDVLAEKE